MLSYTFSVEGKAALYEQLAAFLRRDILSGKLHPGEKLPSRRSLAEHLGISSITVENAYNLLIDHGLITSEPRRGYFVVGEEALPLWSESLSAPKASFSAPPASSDFAAPGFPSFGFNSSALSESESASSPPRAPFDLIDLSGGRAADRSFPFSIWSRLIRRVIAEKGEQLLTPSPAQGILPLRQAIAAHLSAFRGMSVSPSQVVVGAGTEYLYGLLIQLLGRDRIFAAEDPGYPKIRKIYAANEVRCLSLPMDALGLSPTPLFDSGAEVLHISPTHHFPTGISMPMSRRQELLAWADEKAGRYIIEDDYDSEFRLNGRPIPAMQSLDRSGRVIYINTFSKTLASTIRIAYMVLPSELMAVFQEKLGFYACTVSTFEQYTLAAFLSGGYFEKHLNRMRLSYARLRKELLREIETVFPEGQLRVIELDSGLHFLLDISSPISDRELVSALRERGVRLLPLSAYYEHPEEAPGHQFVVHYSSLSADAFSGALVILREITEGGAKAP